MTSQAIVASPVLIRAADNGKGGLGLEGSRSEVLAAPEFPVLSWSFFWISSYLNTGKKKKVIVFSGFLPLCTAGNDFWSISLVQN